MMPDLSGHVAQRVPGSSRVWLDAAPVPTPQAMVERLDDVVSALLAHPRCPDPLHRTAREVRWLIAADTPSSALYGFWMGSSDRRSVVGLTHRAITQLDDATLAFVIAHELAHGAIGPALDRPGAPLGNCDAAVHLALLIEEVRVDLALRRWGIIAPSHASLEIVDGYWLLGMDLDGLTRNEVLACAQGYMTRDELAERRRASTQTRGALPACTGVRLDHRAAAFWRDRDHPFSGEDARRHDRLCRQRSSVSRRTFA